MKSIKELAFEKKLDKLVKPAEKIFKEMEKEDIVEELLNCSIKYAKEHKIKNSKAKIKQTRLKLLVQSKEQLSFSLAEIRFKGPEKYFMVK